MENLATKGDIVGRAAAEIDFTATQNRLIKRFCIVLIGGFFAFIVITVTLLTFITSHLINQIGQ